MLLNQVFYFDDELFLNQVFYFVDELFLNQVLYFVDELFLNQEFHFAIAARVEFAAGFAAGFATGIRHQGSLPGFATGVRYRGSLRWTSKTSFKDYKLNYSKRPGVRFGRGRGRGREQNTFPGAGAGGVAGNYRPGSPYLAGAGNGDKPSPGAGNSRRRESRSFPAKLYTTVSFFLKSLL